VSDDWPRVTGDPLGALADSVKSAILDRIIDDLRRQSTYTTPQSYYAKSDSGLYGKYQKAEQPDMAMLAAIHGKLQEMVEAGEKVQRHGEVSRANPRDTGA
jgi:hypothetical protein